MGKGPYTEREAASPGRQTRRENRQRHADESCHACFGRSTSRYAARFYASLTPATRPKPPSPASARQADLGRLIATAGASDQGIPACDVCHGPRAIDRYPRLAGQHGAYAAGQMRLWKSGGRREGELAAIMSPIAQRLTDEQIDAVAAYYDGLPPEPPPSPEAKEP